MLVNEREWGFFFFLMLNGCCVLVRATCWVLGALVGFEGKEFCVKRRGWCPCVHINTGNYMIAAGVCGAGLSLFWFVYFYHSKVIPLICPCGWCCTQEAASALFSRVSFTCAAPRRELHHLHPSTFVFLMQCCCLYGQVAHVSKGSTLWFISICFASCVFCFASAFA